MRPSADSCSRPSVPGPNPCKRVQARGISGGPRAARRPESRDEQVTEVAIRSAMHLPLMVDCRRSGSGCAQLYSDQPDGLDSDDVAIAHILARHASAAISRPATVPRWTWRRRPHTRRPGDGRSDGALRLGRRPRLRAGSLLPGTQSQAAQRRSGPERHPPTKSEQHDPSGV